MKQNVGAPRAKNAKSAGKASDAASGAKGAALPSQRRSTSAQQKLVHRRRPQQRSSTIAAPARTALQPSAQKALKATKSSLPRARVREMSAVKKRPQPLARTTSKQSRATTRHSVSDPVVFDASVSDGQHWASHGRGNKAEAVGPAAATDGRRRRHTLFCVRCDVQRHWQDYLALSATGSRAAWLGRGVGRTTGLWGLGCVPCSKFLASGKKLPAKLGRAKGVLSKFAKFEVRPTSSFHARFLIERHSAMFAHRMVTGTCLLPPERSRRRVDSPPRLHRPAQPDAQIPPQPLACLLGESAAGAADAVPAADAALLKGNVPSPEEWENAWSLLSEDTSCIGASRILAKQAASGATPEWSVDRQRKRLRRQLCVMAEVLRRKIRQELRLATCITLALDESRYRKIVRYRADVPDASHVAAEAAGSHRLGSRWRHVGACGFSTSGVLGILDCSKKHPSDFEDDHAVTAVKMLDSFLTRFCTPLGRSSDRRNGTQPLACDEELKTHLLNTVTCLSADGAAKERRAVFLAARELFPNVLIVIRDSAHAIRIAMKALHCDEVFASVWKELFDQRHALVPDLMNSQKWQNLLAAIQEDTRRVILSRPGLADYPQLLAGVQANVAFAKQRFDSTAGPVAKVALMLLPIATLLAHIASDQRHDPPQRDRATALLQKLDSRFCTATGVSADWGIVCTWFLRRFDVACHDIAKSRSEIDCMIETLDATFAEGRVFQELLNCAHPAVVGGCGGGGGGGGGSGASAAAAEPLPPRRSPWRGRRDRLRHWEGHAEPAQKVCVSRWRQACAFVGGAAGKSQGGAHPPVAERGRPDKGTPPRGLSTGRRALGLGDVRSAPRV